MESGRLFSLLLFILPQVSCDETMDVMFNQIEGMNAEMAHMRRDMSRLEQKILRKIDFTKDFLRSKIKQHIKRQVREAVSEILQGGDIEEMVTSQIVTEVRELHQGQVQMKRQLQQVVKSLRDIQEERKTYEEDDRNASLFVICSKYVADYKMLQRELEQCDKERGDRNKENQELVRNMVSLNKTCHLRVEQINARCDVTSNTSYIEPQAASASVTTTSQTTTTETADERTRMIVAPYWHKVQQQFHQLNMDSNTISNYPYLSLKYVTSVVYVSKLNKLLIGVRFPDKIISCTWGSSALKTVRNMVSSYGMSVDEDRRLVLMTTYTPRRTISRMTTHGKRFTTIANLTKDSIPFTIATDPVERRIYACDSASLFVMTYHGRHVQTLATGSRILAVTLDNTAGILYYNNNQTLRKLSLSDNVSSDVTSLDVEPQSFVYYNNTVYFSNYGYSDTHTIGAVRVGDETVSYTVNTVSDLGGYALLMCLIP